MSDHPGGIARLAGNLAQVCPCEALPLYDPPCGLRNLFAALFVIYHPRHPCNYNDRDM